MSSPGYTHRQVPQTLSVVQQLVEIIAPQRVGAVVLAPHPATQPVPHSVLCFAERARALPVRDSKLPLGRKDFVQNPEKSPHRRDPLGMPQSFQFRRYASGWMWLGTVGDLVTRVSVI
jgi:hypothetical protein